MVNFYIAGSLMIIFGLAIAGIWTKDIISSDDIDLSPGFFKARDRDDGGLYWPHWFAEYITAATLIAGGICLFFNSTWSMYLSFFALGALFYTSLNSQSWAWSKRERYVYAIPMVGGVCAAIASVVLLLV